jgi:hypothetical protein
MVSMFILTPPELDWAVLVLAGLLRGGNLSKMAVVELYRMPVVF